MLKEYLELAEKRVGTKFDDYSKSYSQPEDYGYDFKNWVSPYTKGASVIGGIAIVLQDWTGSKAINGGVNDEVQEYGRTIGSKTDKNLEHLLNKFFNFKIKDTYATNVFPFIKKGDISSGEISKVDIRKSANIFLRKEMEIVKPSLILALGNLACFGLQNIDEKFVELPHPAARISLEKHEKIWGEKLQQYNL